MHLVIETAGPACSVALFEGDRVVAAAHDTVGRGHAERLIPMIAALPGGGRADAILVDCGPGSFTGLRVGIAAARGLALGWSVPITGYSALALLAADHFAGCDDTQVGIGMPGGHGEVFVQSFARAPLRETDALRSQPTDTAVRTANYRLADPLRLDACRTALLGSDWVNLPLRPIYGRGADAKPMA